jgi:hypothetical protein
MPTPNAWIVNGSIILWYGDIDPVGGPVGGGGATMHDWYVCNGQHFTYGGTKYYTPDLTGLHPSLTNLHYIIYLPR